MGSNTKVYNNIGYTTKNSGTATIPDGSTSVTVNHDLADTPSIVTVLLTKTQDFGLLIRMPTTSR